MKILAMTVGKQADTLHLLVYNKDWDFKYRIVTVHSNLDTVAYEGFCSESQAYYDFKELVY